MRRRIKEKSNNFVIFLIVLLQMFLLGTNKETFTGIFQGRLPFQHSSEQIGSNTNHDFDHTQYSAGTGHLETVGMNKESQGSYITSMPPLNIKLRPYYSIVVLINVNNNHIYQQFATVPKVQNIPDNIRIIMARTNLQTATRQFYVVGTNQKIIQNDVKHSRVIRFENLKYDKNYTTDRANLHFKAYTPIVIPPKTGQPVNLFIKFTRDSLITTRQNHSFVFRKIDSQQAKNLLARGSNLNFKSVGY